MANIGDQILENESFRSKPLSVEPWVQFSTGQIYLDGFGIMLSIWMGPPQTLRKGPSGPSHNKKRDSDWGGWWWWIVSDGKWWWVGAITPSPTNNPLSLYPLSCVCVCVCVCVREREIEREREREREKRERGGSCKEGTPVVLWCVWPNGGFQNWHLDGQGWGSCLCVTLSPQSGYTIYLGDLVAKTKQQSTVCFRWITGRIVSPRRDYKHVCWNTEIYAQWPVLIQKPKHQGNLLLNTVDSPVNNAKWLSTTCNDGKNKAAFFVLCLQLQLCSYMPG